MPDIDLVLGSYGLAHRTLTHSILLWSVAFIPVFIRYRKHSIPYFMAPIQHILLGDVIVNKTSLFWPFSNVEWGLGFPILSTQNIILEVLGLAIFLVWVNKNSSGRVFFNVKKGNLLSIITVLPLLGFLLFVYGNSVSNPFLMEHVMQFNNLEESAKRFITSSLFPVVMITHLVMVSFLLIPLVQGSRAVLRKRINNKTET